jgi:hypothetical protein
MKLKDFLSAVVKNKKNKQLNASFKKTKLKEAGISADDLLNMKIDTKFKTLLKD